MRFIEAMSMAVGCASIACGGSEDVTRVTSGGNATDRTEPLLESGALRAELNDAEALEIPTLDWQACGTRGAECATLFAPRDYADPHGEKMAVAVARVRAVDPARRLGTLFINFGGPGSGTVGFVQATGVEGFPAFSERFDVIGFDPRGTGRSEAAIDCHVDQEVDGLYAQPFTTPLNLDVDDWRARAQRLVDACMASNRDIFEYAATASVARDMDLLRAALGEDQLSYFGYSYGTFLGATYVSLFPDRYRSVVLDGGINPDLYINRPYGYLQQQTSGFERAMGRFFEACARDQAACFGFGGDDPHRAFDGLVARANAEPIAVGGDPSRPLDGDDILFVAQSTLYSKFSWSSFAQALAQAQAGDFSTLRAFADSSYGRRTDGTYSPITDRYFTLTAAEADYSSESVEDFRLAGESSWALADHFFFNAGYSELPMGLFPVHARGVFRGPFTVPAASPTVLVVGTTFDPATPYRGAELLVEQLQNARLLTMHGDGHTAYGGQSACIDAAVEAYFNDGVVPELGAECEQEVAFESVGTASVVAARPVLTPPSREPWLQRLAR